MAYECPLSRLFTGEYGFPWVCKFAPVAMFSCVWFETNEDCNLRVCFTIQN